MQKHVFLFIILLAFICSCSNNNQKKVKVLFKPKGDLILTDQLRFTDTNRVFIGNVRDLITIGNKIYYSDRSNFKIHSFDQKLNYIKSSAGFGRGPGEFLSAPFLADDFDTLVCYEPGINKLEYLDSNFQIVKTITPPPNYLTDLSSRPVFRTSEILISAFNKFLFNRKDISDITTALLIDYNGIDIKNFCPFNKVYDGKTNIAYYNSMETSLVANGFNDTYFVLQMATNDLYQYDSSGTYLRTLYYKPKYYKNPPTYTTNELRQLSNEDRYKVYTSQITFFKSLYFDAKNNLLYLNYNNSKIEQLYSRSLLDTENYLAVFDSTYKCIYDNKLEGIMFDVNDGIIYTLISENPLIINKYYIWEK